MVSIDIHNSVYIFSNIFMTYTVYKFMKIFYEKENTKAKAIEIGLYAIYFIAITILRIFVNIPIILLISNLGLFLMLTLNYKGSFKKKILTAFLIYLTLMCIEMIIVLSTGYFKLDFLIRNNYESILGIIIIRIVSYFVVLIIASYKNIRQGDIVPNTYWVCILIIPIGTLYLLITTFMVSGLASVTIFIAIALVLFINFATFYLYDEISRILSEEKDKILMQQQNKYYENQLELMRASLKSIKTIKHDLKNHMGSLYALGEEDKKEELLKYLSGMIEVLNNKEGLASTGNTVIDSIINFKLQEAEKEKIAINIDLNIPRELKIPSFDITIILGNLLDNALNAVKKLEKDRYIDIKIKYTKGRLIVRIDNSFDGIIIKEKGRIITSHRDKNNHGLGLESVKTVLEKYNGTIEFKYDRNKFHTGMLMFIE
ncbi:GHKL domain-containing protein [Tissierella praeacuta DSM 18095]|uniref:GHKL domain-containing protein n=1 Tax=Tissierella praeacuta DSM 18095 TaxID=1123404 RepID=A0A1M4XIV2_9FIRM|nr:GHKL domain-containing protein [Tissierella praeacuta]SHE93092.1 GHKL domain-containing protein [Tissierella praeacuta DSM 18095]SUP02103.1 sensory histidine kinase DcuS [Tissierella praeacuta]